jgi:hypothetical protein
MCSNHVTESIQIVAFPVATGGVSIKILIIIIIVIMIIIIGGGGTGILNTGLCTC